MRLDGATLERWLEPLRRAGFALEKPQDGLSLEYRWASAEEVADLEKEVDGFIRADGVERAGPKRREAWERGWQENLEALLAGGELEASTMPRYFRSNPWHRVEGRLAYFEDPFAEYKALAALRKPLFQSLLADCKEIVEFGCGSGQNLREMALLLPGRRLRGYDWVEPSRKLADELGQRLGIDLRGGLFDMERPDRGVKLGRRTGVLTYHAFEQLGDRFGPMLDYLVEQGPRVVVQVEPVEENYDRSRPLDRLALAYHRHRGYLAGYLTELRRRARLGGIEILASFRVPFGSRFHEANGVIVWRAR